MATDPWADFDPTAQSSAPVTVTPTAPGPVVAPAGGTNAASPVSAAALPVIPGSQALPNSMGLPEPAADPWANFDPTAGAAPSTPATQPPQSFGDYWNQEANDAIGGAWNRLKGDFQQSANLLSMDNEGAQRLARSGTGTRDALSMTTAGARLPGDVISLLTSPGQALMHGVLIRPPAELMDSGQSALGINARPPSPLEAFGAYKAGAKDPFAMIPTTPQQRHATNERSVNGLLMVAGSPAAEAAPAQALEGSGLLSSRAAKYLGGLLGKPDEAMVAAQAAGKPVTTAEMLGSPGRTALAATARRPGATGPAMEGVMTDRLEGLPQTMLDDFEKATGVPPHAARGDMEALSEANRQGAVKPAYDAALQQPVTMTPQLASVLQEPEVQIALTNAKRMVGKNAMTMGVKIDPDTGAQVLDPLTQQPVLEPQPTAETLDLTKKFLGKSITRDPITAQPVASGQAGTENVFLQKHLRTLTDALAGNDAAGVPAAIPGYRAALDAAGDTLKTEQAFKLGRQHVLNPNVSAADVQKVVGDMSPSELQAYQGGQANALFDRAQNGTLTPKKLLTPNVQQKLAASLGQDKADAFATSLRHSKALADNARQITPQAGTQTAPLNAEMARQDSGGGLLGDAARDFIVGTVAGGGHPAMGLHLAGLNMAKKAATSVGGLLSDAKMPVSVRDEVGGILGAAGSSAYTPEQLTAMVKNARKLPPPDPLKSWMASGKTPPVGLLAPPVLAAPAGLLGAQPSQR